MMKGWKIVLVGDRGESVDILFPGVKAFLIELEVPEHVCPMFNAEWDMDYTGRINTNVLLKCRAPKAKVVSILEVEIKQARLSNVVTKLQPKIDRCQVTNHPSVAKAPPTVYRVGRWVKADIWNDTAAQSPFACDHGIHFFLNTKTIVEYLNRYFI
jgi:hypothetical protein